LKAKEILMEEGNVQYVDSPVTVSWSSAATAVEMEMQDEEGLMIDMW
jgi:hypothetical protein